MDRSTLAYARTLTYVVPPECKGQTVTRSYSDPNGEFVYRRTFDASDRTESYDCVAVESVLDYEDWAPQNGAPHLLRGLEWVDLDEPEDEDQ